MSENPAESLHSVVSSEDNCVLEIPFETVTKEQRACVRKRIVKPSETSVDLCPMVNLRDERFTGKNDGDTATMTDESVVATPEESSSLSDCLE